ncbi:MAG: hypothetical protein ACR2P3_02240 [Geminicoccaceae bacterium]
MSSVFKALVLASSISAWLAAEAASAEYQCRKKESSVRIAIEVEKAGHTLPCKVVAEDDRGQRGTLYSAQYDRNYCPSRIEKTRDELEQEGWSCQKTSDENIVWTEASSDVADNSAASRKESDVVDGGMLLAGNDKAVTASEQCRRGNSLRRIHIEVEDPTQGIPCELLYWSDGDQTKPGQLLWRAEHDAEFCRKRLNVITEKWADEGWSCDAGSLQQAAVVIVDSEPDVVIEQEPSARLAQSGERDQAGAPDVDSKLEAIIAADAERISEWMEVEPAIEIAARGDLNDDGSDDAVVFLAYQSDQSAYRQYLMSYLVAEDGGYELASVKLLTGVSPPPAQARVEQIDKGVIWLTLPDQDGSTPEQTGYRLRDQQLIEVEPASAADTGN